MKSNFNLVNKLNYLRKKTNWIIVEIIYLVIEIH